LRDSTARCNAQRECRMSLEALVGVRLSSLFDSMLRLRSSYSNNYSFPLDVFDRYSNLKAAWDSLMRLQVTAIPEASRLLLRWSWNS
jgi:hypothetical protein